MPATKTSFYSRRLGVPFVLLALCQLALFSSVFGLSLTSTAANNRVADLQTSWQAVTQDNIDASEVLTTDRLLRAVAKPFPAVESAARWSLAMAALGLVLLVWFFVCARKVDGIEVSSVHQKERNSFASMSRLLDEVAPLASGDLNVTATATSGTPGALADTFNYAISELQRLTSSQVHLNSALSNAVGESRGLAGKIEHNGTDQSERILAASNSLLGLSTTSGELTANLSDTKVFARTLADSADSGSIVLRTLLTRARSVGGSAGQSTKLIQSIQQQSQTISDSISTLEKLTRRCELLALNATLESPKSGLGKNRAQSQPSLDQLLSEFPSLAGQLARSVSNIQSLCEIMMADASDALSSMQEFNKSFDEFTSDADSLTYSMTDIQQSAVAVQERTTQLAQKSVQQNTVVSELSASMELINRMTQQVLQDVRENANSLDGVKDLSNRLRQRLPDLRLPERKDVAANRPVSSARRAADRAVLNV